MWLCCLWVVETTEALLSLACLCCLYYVASVVSRMWLCCLSLARRSVVSLAYMLVCGSVVSRFLSLMHLEGAWCLSLCSRLLDTCDPELDASRSVVYNRARYNKHLCVCVCVCVCELDASRSVVHQLLLELDADVC